MFHCISYFRQGVETEVTAIMKFSNNRFGTFIISTNVMMPNEAFVSGTKGTLKVYPNCMVYVY